MESLWSQIAHNVSAASGIIIIGILLKEHTTWVRLKDRMNQLWRKYCKETGQDFFSLENGRH